MRFRRPTLALSSAAALLLGACVPTPPVHTCPRFHDELCEQRLEKGNLDEAEIYCDLGLEFSPEYARLWVLKGRIALQSDTAALLKRPDLNQLYFALAEAA